MIPGSAIRVSAAWSSESDESVSEMIGRSAGSKRRMIGSSISCGSSPRIAASSSRTSCDAWSAPFSKTKIAVIVAKPSDADERTSSIPSIPRIASSTGSTTSRSTTVGSAPG